MERIVASKPTFYEDDISYVTDRLKNILKGNSFLSQYKYSEKFENYFADYVGSKYAVSCNSGTSALELIFRGLEIEGKEVIMPSNTFIATANAIINAGGKPVFADCDDKMCLDYNDTITKITKNTIAICHVHIGGLVSKNSLKISNYCKENNIYFVEDAAQAHGSSLNGKKAGSLGIAAGFSFYSTKVLTTGEGGMITTDDYELVSKMKSMREFGKVKKGIFTNYHERMGYNWRMPEVSALMGIRQLKHISIFIDKRESIANFYNSLLKELKHTKIIYPSENSYYNYFKYILILESNISRDIVHKKLASLGVQLSGYVYELPLHKQPVFKQYNNVKLPMTEALCAQHICLPIYPLLKVDEAKKVCENLISIIHQF